MQFSSDLDANTKKQIDGGRRMTEMLKQPNGKPIAFEMESAVIFAAVNGYFDGFAPEDTSKAEERLQDFLDREGTGVLAASRTTKEIGEVTEKDLRALLDTFVSRSA
jgi:F-type H+-transporting ATPase subunit alpha